MKKNDTGTNKGLKLRRQTEEMLTRSASSLKKMSAVDIRNLLEDLQIYQVELEEQNKQLLKMQEELKQTGEALWQSEMRYRALFQESREAKSLAKNGKIVEVNAKWLELHGFDDEKEVLGKDVLQFIHEEDRRILEDRRKRWSEKLEAVYELRDVRRDGSIVEVEVYSSRILIGGEVAFLATIHDISDRKRLEEQTRKIRKIEAMATLTGGIAQHFNNALSAITAHNWILEMNFSDNEEIMQCVKPMKRATERMADLTAQLLACRFGGRYYPKAILISDYVKTILLSMRRDIPDSVQLEFKPEPDLPRVTADPNQISMAVSAVIVNAVEAVEKKGFVRISCQTETLNGAFRRKHPDYEPGPYVCVQVEDNGKGMDSETLSRAFDPFFTTHFVGRGLGLSVAYGIVNNHGGFISIESELKKGSTVRLYLPISDDDKIGDQENIGN
jgi:two-component system, cell cycle sensor histidine kinase and response regulator CckA